MFNIEFRIGDRVIHTIHGPGEVVQYNNDSPDDKKIYIKFDTIPEGWGKDTLRVSKDQLTKVNKNNDEAFHLKCPICGNQKFEKKHLFALATTHELYPFGWMPNENDYAGFVSTMLHIACTDCGYVMSFTKSENEIEDAILKNKGKE